MYVSLASAFLITTTITMGLWQVTGYISIQITKLIVRYGIDICSEAREDRVDSVLVLREADLVRWLVLFYHPHASALAGV